VLSQLCSACCVLGVNSTIPGGYKHILVAVDKFTKWIEVRLVGK
jgi:hypothetical protein